MKKFGYSSWSVDELVNIRTKITDEVDERRQDIDSDGNARDTYNTSSEVLTLGVSMSLVSTSHLCRYQPEECQDHSVEGLEHNGLK